MADVAISYAREDSDAAAKVARSLEGREFSVFLDRGIPSGEEWRVRISEELEAAGAIVVLWSRTSVTKSYVREEADAGMRRGVLLPVSIEPDVQLPFGFRELQAIQLAIEPGFESSDAFVGLLRRIHELTGPPALSREEAERGIASLPLFRSLHESHGAAPGDVVRLMERYQRAPWFPFRPDRMLEALSAELVAEKDRGTVEIMAFQHFDGEQDILRAMQLVERIERT